MALEQAFVAADKSAHDLKSFDCGKTEMNEFLARFAIKHNKLGLSRTWVLPDVGSGAEVAQQGKKKTIAAYSLTDDHLRQKFTKDKLEPTP